MGALKLHFLFSSSMRLQTEQQLLQERLQKGPAGPQVTGRKKH